VLTSTGKPAKNLQHGNAQFDSPYPKRPGDHAKGESEYALDEACHGRACGKPY
jgi:hypothetical protein